MHDSSILARLTALVGDFEPGTVCLVGTGPGDSSLITLRGAVRLAQADVVLHDRLIGPELLDIAASRPTCVFVGKWRGQHSWTQDQINAGLVQHARAGKRVVRLKGGDPFVFGRGGEECEHLARAGIRFEVVPGITAAFGAPATAGIPLTHRDLSRTFALVTGHAEADSSAAPDYAAIAKIETIALYMGLKQLDRTCRGLIAASMAADTPAAVIQWGTRPQQRTIVGTLDDIAGRAAAQQVSPPAMIVIGKVVRLRQTIEWFEGRPLHGQRILITRARDQAAALSGALMAAGAEVIEAPTIEIAEIEDPAPADRALLDIGRYDWLVVTSANGVDALLKRLVALGRDARGLAGPRIAAVGEATADQLAHGGIRADLVPSESVGEALADALIRQDIGGKRILLLRGDLARAELPARLRAAGAACDDIVVYRTVCPPSLPEAVLDRLDRGEIDWITLTSPSSFENLLLLLRNPRRELLRTVRLASIGPVTTRAIRGAGFTEAVEAEPHDVPGLVAAIRNAVQRA